jgi:hypothetical protein
MSKAFDKMSHEGLFLKLMDRLVPVCLLNVLEHWFNICITCVRWGSSYSNFFRLACGVRQGGVLSPHLFSVYIDDIVNSVAKSKSSISFNFVCMSIFLYADDILLISPSVSLLQNLVNIVENDLLQLDMSINPKKSVCFRVGLRFEAKCANILLSNGSMIPWVSQCRYLGVYFQSARYFKCVFDESKKSWFRSFNAIYGKVGRCASLEVVFQLLISKCLPIFTYGLNACPINSSDRKSLDFVIFRTVAKILGTFDSTIIADCRNAFGLYNIVETINKLKIRFLMRYSASENIICRVFACIATSELTSLRLQQSLSLVN